MGWLDRFRDSFAKNPLAWLAFAAFVVAEYSNYQHTNQLDRVCELLPHDDIATFHPRTPSEEIDYICRLREAADNSEPD